ncbi:uncharacterized protein LOC106515281 [Austrofundulus limnaeus]|uniref:Uncharacterized protein LOC106515281 n=1 Tax=Austrofundulus limnaeus TaxID=52670 RepID=A0A2I4AY84_AUSLI|nr:PREDICTED: uncharacterized protein LOC106515281 [Austrofundulus limnaeus]XP_013860446.1 PREDICTED: uncharacterized protein LOC106515281 [Austrofundulus limnaeus]
MFAALHLFCLLSAFTLTKQGSVSLEVNPTILAERGEQVSLRCSPSSSHHGLSVKHMEWSRGSESLCSVNSKQDVITHESHSLSDFYCTYRDGQLSLFFQRMLPLESGRLNPYRCKLHSNQGVAFIYTTVELQESCGEVGSVLTKDGPSCTFSHVYPDADVLWFHDSQDLSDGSVNRSTSKTVDEHGWLTIRSWLSSSVKQEWGSSREPYNCSLQSSTSGRIITSTLVRDMRQKRGPTASDGNGVKSHKTMTTVFSILVSLIVRGK